MATGFNAPVAFNAPIRFNGELSPPLGWEDNQQGWGSDTLGWDQDAVIQPPEELAPVASFTIDDATVFVGDTITFTDTTTNVPTAWEWTFGDTANSVTTQNATHAYASAGTFTVTLTAWNSVGSDTATATVTIEAHVVIPPPEVPPDAIVVVVEIGVPPSMASSATTWALGNDPRGRLDTGGTLPDRYLWFPITDDVVGISIDRGRSRELDRTDAGTATITLRDDNPDTARRYDAQNILSPYWPYFGPRSRVRISIDGVTIFGGDITSTPVTDDVGNQVVTTINATEISGRLNRKITYLPEATHTAGRRIARILERAGWEDGTDLPAGIRMYQAGGYDDVGLLDATAWDLIQDISFAEGGLVFVAADGESVVFHTRAQLSSSPSTATFSDDIHAALQFDGLTRDFGMEQIYNAVTFKSIADEENVTASNRDEISIGEFGEIPLETTSPIGGDTIAGTQLMMQERVNQIVRDFSRPIPRFQTVTIQAAKLTTTRRQLFVLPRDLGDCITVERHPTGAGWPTVISQNCTIIGIAYEISPNLCEATFTLTPQLAPA